MVRLNSLVSFSHTYDATCKYLSKGLHNLGFDSDPIPGDNVEVVIWSSVELNLAILCGSLPALRPLFKKVPPFFATFRTTLQSGNRRQSLVPSSTAKLRSSRGYSAQSSPESSPTKPIQPRQFGSSSTAKETHVAGETASDTGSKDDLERQDWDTEKDIDDSRRH